MENIKIGDVVNVKVISDVRIVVTHVTEKDFQGVYFSNVTQEFKITPMMPITLAEINEE